MSPTQFKSLAEMQRIREADAKLREIANRNFIPEPWEHKVVANFEVCRYTTGQCRGLYLVFQVFAEDNNGRTLRKPMRKLIAEGVDKHMVSMRIREAIDASENRRIKK